MPNTFFQFKKFRIDQDFQGLGVTTDACILGAWASPENTRTLLDIGTGTGVLSLMQLQKNEQMQVDAIEISKEAADLARKNFSNSPWAKQISLFHSSLEAFSQNNDQTYDAIIANPPFFKNHPKSHNTARDFAIHDDQLPMEGLLGGISRHLKNTGKAFVMYPLHESLAFEQLLVQKGLFLLEELNVYNHAAAPVFRRILVIGKEKTVKVSRQLIIRSEEAYSAEFTQLLKHYYLHL